MDRSLTWLSYVALWVARLNIVEVEAITIRLGRARQLMAYQPSLGR